MIKQTFIFIFILLFPFFSFGQSIQLSEEMKLRHEIILKTYLKLCSLTQGGCNFIGKKIGIYTVGSDGSAVFFSENTDVNFQYGYFSSGEYNWVDNNGVSHTSSWRHVGAYKNPSGQVFGGSTWGSKLLQSSGNDSVNFYGNGTTHLPIGDNFPDRVSQCFAYARDYLQFCFYGFGSFQQDGNSQQNLTCTCSSGQYPQVTVSDGWMSIPNPFPQDIIDNNRAIVSQLQEAKQWADLNFPTNDIAVIDQDYTNTIDWLTNGVSTPAVVGSSVTSPNPFDISPSTSPAGGGISYNIDMSSTNFLLQQIVGILDYSTTDFLQVTIDSMSTSAQSSWDYSLSIRDYIVDFFSLVDVESYTEWDGCFAFDFSTSFQGGQSVQFCLSQIPGWDGFALSLIRVVWVICGFLSGMYFFFGRGT